MPKSRPQAPRPDRRRSIRGSFSWIVAELLDIRFPHELEAARNELVARDLIAYEGGIYQVLDLPACSPRKARDSSPPPTDHALHSSSSLPRVRKNALREAASDLESVKRLLEQWGWGRT